MAHVSNTMRSSTQRPMLRLLIPAILVGLLCVACVPAASTTPTPNLPDTSTDTVAIPTAQTTLEVLPTLNFVTDDGHYSVIVRSLIQGASLPEGVPDAPDESRYVIVAGTLSNNGGPDVTITSGTLTLITADGTRIAADAPDDTTQPPMVGSTLADDDDVVGLARFLIPDEATPGRLEWCPAEECIQSPIPPG